MTSFRLARSRALAAFGIAAVLLFAADGATQTKDSIAPDGEAGAPAQTEAADAGALRPDEGDQAAVSAREAFRRGTALARAGHWREALAEFERSAELRPHAVTTYNQAFCERAIGRYTRARRLFAKALFDHKARGGVELPDNLVKATDDYLADVERKLARWTAKVAPADAAVSIDGAPLELLSSELGTPLLVAGTRSAGPPESIGASAFEVWLDPGPHRVVVARAGLRDVVVERVATAGERGTVDLVMRSDDLDDSRATSARSTRRNRTASYAAFGAGGVGLAVGITAGIVALVERSKLRGACENKNCYPGEGQDTLGAARTAADVATIGFAVGAAGAAAGAILWLIAAPGDAAHGSSPAASGFRAEIGLGSISIEKRF